MNTYEIEQFKNKIIDLTNETGLNIGIIYYVFKDLYQSVEQLYHQQIQNDYIKYQQEKQENEKKEE